MKKIKVEQNEPFEVKITINGTDFFKQVWKITSLKGTEVIPTFGKPYLRMEPEIEYGDSMYFHKNK